MNSFNTGALDMGWELSIFTVKADKMTVQFMNFGSYF